MTDLLSSEDIPDGTRTPTKIFSALGDFGDRLAIVDEGGRSWSHAEFARFADQQCHLLPRHRCLVAVEARNDLHSVATYVGALRAGHSVLLLQPGEGVDSPVLARFPASFVYSLDGAAGRLQGTGSPPIDLHPDLAVLLTTSGSTGAPKLVRLSHANLISNALSIAEYLEFGPGERAITTLPFHYSYGMSVINSHLATGQAVILNQSSLVEPAFWGRFEAFGATSFAGVPHSFALLEQVGFHRKPLPGSLRYFTQAGGKLPDEAVLRFAECAEEQGRRFYVMYGQTEASPRIAYVPPALLKQHPGSIGVPIPGGSLSLQDERGMPVTGTGLEGELVYAGPNVMMGYGIDPEDLARGPELAKLQTGDLAIRNADGLYNITGRKSRFIKPFGIRIGLDDVEARLRGEGLEAAATGSDNGLQIAAVAPASAEAVIDHVLRYHHLSMASVEVVTVPELPRLPSGKVDYAAVRALCAAARSPAATAPAALSLQDAFAELLGRQNITPKDSFASAGGDSLNFINALMLVEERLGFAPKNWERMPIGELEAMAARRSLHPEPAAQSKLFFLDQIRAGLMLMGIPYHTALLYTEYPWIVKAGAYSPVLETFSQFLSTFRMPAFFLLAGFFAMMFVDPQRPMKWWKNRAVQLGIPLVSTALLLNPLMMLAHVIYAPTGQGIWADWGTMLSRPGRHWVEHLWFLIFLIVYSLLLAAMLGLRRKDDVVERLSVVAASFVSSRLRLAVAAISAGALTALAVGLLKTLGITFIFWNFIYLSEMVSLLPLFAMGCILGSRREYMERFASFDWLSLVIGLSGIAVLASIQVEEGAIYRAVTFFLVPVTGIYCAKLLFFMAFHWLNAANRWTQKFVDASMTVYLVHMVIIVILGCGFSFVAIPTALEFSIIVVLTTALSFLAHKLIMAHWLLTLLFTGAAKRRGKLQPAQRERPVYGAPAPALVPAEARSQQN
jgi:acyl-CoA synthetase (AMP-forming)/AMP-acid ligase II